MTPSAVAVGGLVLDIAGALMLALGLVLKKSEAALDEATPKYDFNAALDASLAAQTADAQVGATMLCSGFGVQMAAALGWHETSRFAVALALATGVAAVVAAWAFLVHCWRPHKIREALSLRLRSLDVGTWWPALAAFGVLLSRPRYGDEETIAAYGERLLGARRWAALTERIDPSLMIPLTKPRSEIPGTREYEKAHAGDSAPGG